MAEYLAEIDNMDEGCATSLRVYTLKRPPRVTLKCCPHKSLRRKMMGK